MKKLKNNIRPATKHISSSINGTLDITWINNKKVLDSENANYSYGSLQRLLEHGLSKIYFDLKSPALILGMGGGSVLYSLRKELKHIGKITAIEIDPVIIKIATDEFEIETLKDISIICTDAFSYVTTIKNSYNLILVDLFIDRDVPETCFSLPFWKDLHNCLSLKGNVLFNAGILVEDDTAICNLIKDASDLFTFERYDKVQGTNLLVIARKK